MLTLLTSFVKLMEDNKEIPKHILHDEELTVVLKALEQYRSKHIKEVTLAQNIAMSLRNKAGWEGYEKPDKPAKELEELPNENKLCSVCNDY